MDPDWDLFEGSLQGVESSDAWFTTAAYETSSEFESLPEFGASLETSPQHSFEESNVSEQVPFPCAPFCNDVGSEDYDQLWPARQLSPKRRQVQAEPTVHTPPKLAATEIWHRPKQPPSVAELVNTNMAALQESAAELLSICHHRPGGRSPKRQKPSGQGVSDNRPRQQTRSLSFNDLVMAPLPGCSIKTEPLLSHTIFCNSTLQTPPRPSTIGRKRSVGAISDWHGRQPDNLLQSSGLRQEFSRAKQPGLTSAFSGPFAPATPAKESPCATPTNAESGCDFYNGVGSSCDRLEPFSIVKDSPFASTVTLGQLNQRMEETAAQYNTCTAQRSAAALTRRPSAGAPPYNIHPPISRARSLTQISNQLAGMTSLTISNGVIIKPE
ncbi:hypothetical protein WJX84_000772 [Apatococcus fuscideae]|uniref:Uncharacterized protein n=1 Tax=Apatococcus fuscideae TaxID=2026836 RepID=A0AAW1TB79_9CHLO